MFWGLGFRVEGWFIEFGLLHLGCRVPRVSRSGFSVQAFGV